MSLPRNSYTNIQCDVLIFKFTRVVIVGDRYFIGLMIIQYSILHSVTVGSSFFYSRVR